jgi:HlyD family secretion protein
MKQSNAKSTKNKRRRWPWLFLLLIPVLLLGTTFLGAQRNLETLRNTYTTVKPTIGPISITVYGSGSIEAGQHDSVYAPATGQVQQVVVAVGDRVAAGDVLAVLSSDVLDARITQLESQIDALDQQIAAMPFTAGSATIVAPVAGRIMSVYAIAGDPVVGVMDSYDALLVISADGKMKVVLSEATTLAPGTAVQVVGGSTVDGTVVSNRSGVTTVQFPDTKFTGGSLSDKGEIVTVQTSDGALVGQGILQISAPVYVTASSGIIKSVKHVAGDKVAKGAALFTLTEAGYSSTFLSLIDQRATALTDLQAARDQKSSLTLLAPAAGIVESLAMTEKGQVMENQLVCMIGETGSFQMQVMIDELDIAGIQIGQAATLQLSAFDYKSFPGKVENISSVGRTTGGVTTYPVTLRIDPAAGILLGMSANADILVANKTDALTVPLKALKVDGTRTYVTVVTNNGTRDVATKEVDVTVGLANGNLVEILSGLSATDEVQTVENTTIDFRGMFGRPPSSSSGN